MAYWQSRSFARRSRTIDDARLAAVVSDLRAAMRIRFSPQVRESDELTSAAVVGWRRPTLLLPGDWQSWSASELKAVVAHELAHIDRRDFECGWRRA